MAKNAAEQAKNPPANGTTEQKPPEGATRDAEVKDVPEN